MGRITEALVRKRAEHNDGILSTLREVSLHQQEIEKIEVLNNMCRRLQILYLQNNLISKIENVYRLKELEYLNLALNSITKIENLESCECLRKLDLTANFLDLDTLEESCENMRNTPVLQELYLNGNPCESWEGWRAYVIAMVPRLKMVNGEEVTKSERIIALKRLPELQRELEKLAAEKRDQKAKGIYDSQYTPESRLEMYREMEEKKIKEEKERDEWQRERKPPDLMKEARQKLAQKVVDLPEDGSLPKQRNTGQYDWRITEDDRGNTVVEIDAPRFMATSVMDVDVHPGWMQAKLKDNLILLHFPREVKSDLAKVQRITTTGCLVITVPIDGWVAPPKPAKQQQQPNGSVRSPKRKHQEREGSNKEWGNKHDKGGSLAGPVDYKSIVQKATGGILLTERRRTTNAPNASSCPEASDDFVDDDEVPPLE